MILPRPPDNSSTSDNIDVVSVADQYQSRLTDPSDLSITSIIRGQFIGMILMAILQGLNLCEMARYLHLFKAEQLLRYLLVVPIFLIATFQSAQIFYFTYDLFITHYGNLIRMAYHDWWVESQPTLTAIVMLGVQGYYAKRLWVLEGRRKWLLYFYCVTLPVGLMAGISLTYWASAAPQFKAWRDINQEEVNRFEKLARPFRIVAYVVPMCIDLSIMFGMLWSLARVKKDADAQTQSLVRRLIRIVIETMAMPTLCMTMTAIMGLYYGDANSNERLFSYCQSQLCLFSLLHTLISRKDMRKALNGTTGILPSITVDAPYTPSAVSQEHRFSRDSPGDTKSHSHVGDLSCISTSSRATRLYEDNTIWATGRQRHIVVKEEPIDASVSEIEAVSYTDPAPAIIKIAGHFRHFNANRASQRVWRHADQATSLPAALDLFLWETAKDTENSKNTFGSINPAHQAGARAHPRRPGKSLSESLADVHMLSDNAGSPSSSALCSKANVRSSEQEEGFHVSGIDVTK